MRKLVLIILVIASLPLIAERTVELELKYNEPKQQISRHIYGHFAEHLGRCIYDGFWVDENMLVKKQGRIRMDIVDALKEIKIPNLRWPGGCYADEYQWKDGIGESRPKRLNSHWGQIVEDNSFGTNEFLQLCSLLGCEPYISANVGSGSVNEMREWIEYLNYDGDSEWSILRKKQGREKPWGVSFWGIGNESWGCGGDMTPQFYSDQFRRYSSFARNYSGNFLKKIACGPNSADYNWMETCMKNIPHWLMWGISLHYYTIPSGNWDKKGSSTQFDKNEYLQTIKNASFMEELLNKQIAIMDKYDPDNRVALVVDEWGVWTDVEDSTNKSFLYQQNSMRDALTAAMTLNIFNNHSKRVKMANLAQSINVLQSLVLTNKEKMLLTPTYFVFDLYKVHQDALLIPVNYPAQSNELISVSASKNQAGEINISMVNLDPEQKINFEFPVNGKGQIKEAKILSSKKFTDHNTFENPDKIKIQKFDNAKFVGSKFVAALPPLSVVNVTIKIN